MIGQVFYSASVNSMIDEEPDKIIYDLLRTNWKSGNTTYSSDPKFQTGWYDFGSSEPQVSITNPGSSVVNGGNTGISAVTGQGGVAQRHAGTVTVNCWSGTFQDSRSAGAGNPKKAAFQLAREAKRIILENANGTFTDSGERQLQTLGTGDISRQQEDGNDPVVFRYELMVLYTHVDRNNQIS